MKKHFVNTIAMAALSMLALASCNQSNPQTDNQPAASQGAPAELKIAYVEVDSIMTQYNFCKDYAAILQKKGQNIQNTLAAKERQLQAAAANFQQKVQQNAYTREQAEGIQAGLQKQGNDLQALNQRLSNEFQGETEKYNKALRDSIQHFLAAYNKDKQYSIILSKAGDNLLYANKAYDITNEVIAGLNKAYKPTAELKKQLEQTKTKK